MISAISLPAMTLHEAWNVPGAKCLKRVFTSMRLCVPKLVGRINGSGALSRVNGQRTADRPCRTASECLLELLKQDDHGVERGNLEHSENALIAARTQVGRISTLFYRLYASLICDLLGDFVLCIINNSITDQFRQKRVT